MWLNDCWFLLLCNNDIIQDMFDVMIVCGLLCLLLIVEIDLQLFYLVGLVMVDVLFFDLVIILLLLYLVLFGLSWQLVGDVDYVIGLYVSILVCDGGILQIGIGMLVDVFSYVLVLCYIDNVCYCCVLYVFDLQLVSYLFVQEIGGVDLFEVGLYGCSEMFNEGFCCLVQIGVIRCKVYDDLVLMQCIENGSMLLIDYVIFVVEGEYLYGVFYLGLLEFYEWLCMLLEDECCVIGMCCISEINQLYGGNEVLECLQCCYVCFFNFCMMVIVFGVVVLDVLDDGCVVFGVGGQYNFVVMVYVLLEVCSVLMFCVVCDDKGCRELNVCWNYGYIIIFCYLCDIYFNEYGIVDLCGLIDEDCVYVMIVIIEVLFQGDLLQQVQVLCKLLVVM